MKKKTKKERLIPIEDSTITQQLSSFFGISKEFDWKNVFAKNSNNHVFYDIPIIVRICILFIQHFNPFFNHQMRLSLSYQQE